MTPTGWLDRLVSLLWRPIAWDIPLTRPPGPWTRWRTRSETTGRWVKL